MLVVLSQDRPAALKSVPLFGGLPLDLQARLEAHLERVICGAGEVIFREGDPGDSLYIIEDGAVAIRLVSADGKELELAKLSRGDVFGELALLDGAPRSAEARALTRTKLLSLRRLDFQRALRTDSRLAEALLATLAPRLRRDAEAAREAAFLDVPGRLARALLRLADAAPDDQQLTPPVSQADLARMIGSTRETVNRWLGRYEELHVLRREGARIAILDVEHLRRRGAA
jgi:CRP/FNR family transcriptional regulator, cyclic AMP receptor protein